MIPHQSITTTKNMMISKPVHKATTAPELAEGISSQFQREHTNSCLDMVMPNGCKATHQMKRLLACSHNSAGNNIDIDWEFGMRLIKPLNLGKLRDIQ